MRTLDALAESFLVGAAAERPTLMLAHGGKGGSRRKGKADDDDDPDDDDDDDADDDDDDDADDDDDDDADDDDDDDLAKLDEDELRAELRKTRESLSRSSSANAAKRKRLKAREAELVELRKGKPATKAKVKADKADEPEVDVEAIETAAEQKATAAANERIKKAEARGALRAAGVDGKRVAKAVSLLNLEDVDVDDDGEVEGIDDAIDELRKEWPELFPKGAARKRERVAGDGDRDGRSSRSSKKPSATELQVAAALGKPIRR